MQVIEPRMVPSDRVVWIGAVSLPVTVTVPVALSTVVPKGRLLTVTLFTLVTPTMLAVHEENVWAVVDSLATPGATGLSVTVAVKADTAHLTPVEPPAALAKSAVVPAATEAFSTSPTATVAPSVPAAPVVSTDAGSSARAGDAAKASARAASAAIGAVLDARMGVPLSRGRDAPGGLLRGEAEDRTGLLNAVDVYARSYWRVNPIDVDPFER